MPKPLQGANFRAFGGYRIGLGGIFSRLTDSRMFFIFSYQWHELPPWACEAVNQEWQDLPQTCPLAKRIVASRSHGKSESTK
jgi:hypothetical protein